MLEELIEMHTDEFYEVRDTLKKTKKIQKKQFEKFSNVNELKRLIEEE